jgi:hypothetical protein
MYPDNEIVCSKDASNHAQGVEKLAKRLKAVVADKNTIQRYLKFPGPVIPDTDPGSHPKGQMGP